MPGMSKELLQLIQNKYYFIGFIKESQYLSIEPNCRQLRLGKVWLRRWDTFSETQTNCCQQIPRRRTDLSFIISILIDQLWHL